MPFQQQLVMVLPLVCNVPHHRRNLVPTWLLTYELEIVSSLRDSTDRPHPTRYWRAGLQVVSSPFDKLRAGSSGLDRSNWGEGRL